MKKTKVLIPALALIAFSTVASIAGSVAWFTASRTVNVDAGSYAVVKTSANLRCVASDGAGTTASVVSNIQTISLGSNVLTDGSFDHTTGIIYQPNESGSGIDTTARSGGSYATRGQIGVGEVSHTDASLLERGNLSGGGKVYTAVTFGLTFTISYGSAAGDYGLFLDCYNNDSPEHVGSTFAVSPSAAAKTAKGFRMAFYTTETNGESKVFADLQDGGTWDHDGDGESASPTAQVKKIRYVHGTDNFVGTDYTSAELVNSAYNDQLPTSAITKTVAEARPDYLGFFAFDENEDVELQFTVVCWFEGTDPEIVNRASEDEYQSVVADLHFEAIKLAD